jgi:hypothetical protein
MLRSKVGCTSLRKATTSATLSASSFAVLMVTPVAALMSAAMASHFSRVRLASQISPEGRGVLRAFVGDDVADAAGPDDDGFVHRRGYERNRPNAPFRGGKVKEISCDP